MEQSQPGNCGKCEAAGIQPSRGFAAKVSIVPGRGLLVPLVRRAWFRSAAGCCSLAGLVLFSTPVAGDDFPVKHSAGGETLVEVGVFSSAITPRSPSTLRRPIENESWRREGAGNEGIARLLTVQKQVEQVVSKTMPAVVAISDGVGFGSGVVVNDRGLILTAGHVVNAGPKEFEIFFPSGVTTTAKLVGFNLDVDAAMIQITEPGPWPFAELAEPQSTQLGDWVVCLGHSGGYELGRKPPVRSGRILEYRKHQIVTDAALIGGDSGGPLFDLSGRVIGIHSSIGDLISENRHVSIETFRRDWERMQRGEAWGNLPQFSEAPSPASPGEPPAKSGPRRARMGVEMDPEATGAIIKIVEPNSPAARIGLKPGDRVTEFDGQAIESSPQLIQLIRQKKVGDSASLQIERRGQRVDLRVILEDLP